MRKIFATLLLIFVMSSASYGADLISQDINMYVRNDMFVVYMQSINDKIDALSKRMDGLEKRLDALEARLNVLEERLNALAQTVATLIGRLDGIERRMDRLEHNIDTRFSELRNDIYLGLVILGIIAGLPSLKGFLQWSAARKPSVTLEDVKRLIDENNAKLQAQFMNMAR